MHRHEERKVNMAIKPTPLAPCSSRAIVRVLAPAFTVVFAVLSLALAPAALAAPETELEGGTPLSPFEARLEAIVNPNNEALTCSFEYGTTSAYGSSIPCEPESLEGLGGQSLGATIKPLASGTTYHFRVVLENGAHVKTDGIDAELTTPVAEAPLVEGETFSGLTDSSVQLEAQVNPNFQETTYGFEYATEETLAGATTVPGGGPLAAGFGNEPVAVGVTGLQPRTTYYYRATATNNTGTTPGPTERFETFGAPLVSTERAQDVTRTTAAVSGTVNPGGVPTTYHVAFVAQAAYDAGEPADPYAAGRTTPESKLESEDYEPHPASALIGELAPGVTYDYALVAANSQGTTIGPNKELTTAPATPPFAATGGASTVTSSSATLTATVDTGGLPTLMRFEFGTTPESGSIVPATAVPGSISGTSVGISAGLSGVLQQGTTYYYRVIAANADGTSYGAESAFTTPISPGLALPATVQTITWPASVTKALAEIEKAASAPVTGTSPQPAITNKQKLAKALKACKKHKGRVQVTCEAKARARYAPSHSHKHTKGSR
jgi:hypothetical protein